MRINYKTGELISNEEQSQKAVEFAIEESKLQLQSDILATKQSLANAKIALEVVKTTYPLDSNAILEAKSEVDAYETGLKQLNELKEEFGW